MAQVLFDMGWQQFDEMKLDRARKYARESLALARVVESQQEIATALLLDGLAATESDLVEEAIPVLEESLALFQEVGIAGAWLWPCPPWHVPRENGATTSL